MESDTSAFCPIKPVSFLGANCSDAAGSGIGFADAMRLLKYEQNATMLTGRRWDEATQTPFFNYLGHDSVVHQVWYDDPASLRVKYELARSMGVRGTGPFTFTNLEFGTAERRAESAAMWEALREFTG